MINQRENIVQIGCGVVGSANIKAYKFYGFKVFGLDVLPHIIKKMNNNGIETRNPLKDDITDLTDTSIILISVPTPLDLKTRRLSMRYVTSTLNTVAQLIEQSSKTVIVVMRSTIPPGTTTQFKKDLMKLTKTHFYMAFQPEFLRAVTNETDAKFPWKVMFGYYKEDKEVYDRMRHMLLKFVEQKEKDLRIMNIYEAELHKVLHNYYNGMKISFSNAISGIVESINKQHNSDMDAQHIMDIVSSTAEGYLNPKYGTKVGKMWGGECLSKDIPELVGLVKEYECDERIISFIAGTEEVNNWIDERTDLNIDMEFSPTLMSFDKMKQ